MSLRQLLIGGALLLILGCSDQHVIVAPDGVVMPAGTVIKTVLTGSKPDNSTTVLKVVKLGSITTVDCIIFGETVGDFEKNLANIDNAKLSCAVGGNAFTKLLTGYVVNEETKYAHLPFYCEQPGKCEYSTDKAVFIITEKVKMDNFSFITSDDKETGFIGMSKLIKIAE